MVISSCTSGLCNRIHSVLGCKIIADELKRDFKVYWPNNAELGADFKDLFDSSVATISGPDALHLLSDARVTSKIYNAGLTGTCEYMNIDRHDVNEVIFIKSWTSPVFKGDIHGHDFREKLLQAVKHFPFKREITQKATPQNFVKHVGIHIRFGDYRPYGISHSEYFNESTVDVFRPFMQRIVEARPWAKFYVSCPNPEIKQQLKSEFCAVDFIDVNPYRSLDGARDAILDLTNLSGCAFVIGSHRSQFSQYVGLMSGKVVALLAKTPQLCVGPTSIDTTLDEVLAKTVQSLDAVMTK